MVLGGQVIYPANLTRVQSADRPHCFLFDNGSLRAASTLSLRRTADLLSAAIGSSVQAVSLLHSSAVPTTELNDLPAELLEPALLDWLGRNPTGRAILLPFFFGPSGALTEYLPARLKTIRAKYPQADLRLGRSLVRADGTDTRIASALTQAARETIRINELDRPKVVLVDHGSPQPEVALVRNHLGDQVRSLLGDDISILRAASMERRPGPFYAFNDPLLSAILGSPPFETGEVVILLQFLSPGRHAGPNGDIAQICDEAARGCPSLRTYLTEPIANHPLVVEVLLQRYQETIPELSSRVSKS